MPPQDRHSGTYYSPELLSDRIRTQHRWFLQTVLGVQPWSRQLDIIESVELNRRTMVAGCIASSKTMAAAMTTLWWLSAFQPSRVFAIAPTHRQVGVNFWGELRSLYRGSKIPLGGKMLPDAAHLKIADNWYAMGFSTDEPDRVHGIHGPNDLLIIDEGQGIGQPIWDAVENMMAGGNTRLLVLCNPNVLSGPVYEAFHSRRALWSLFRIPAGDTPNVKDGRVTIPGMITREQVAEWAAVYGKESNFYRVKVDAQFPAQESDTLISVDWIEQAMARSPTPVDQDKPLPTIIGVDVARFGDDRTVMCPLRGREILPLTVLRQLDTMQVSGRVAIMQKETNASMVFVDAIGIGAGVTDRLREIGCPVKGINVGSRPANHRRFSNLRSELWWACRDALDPAGPAPLSLPKDQDLVAELSSVKFDVDSSGHIKIEPKDDTKSRLGYSPDKADAMCLALMGAGLGGPASRLYAPGKVAYAT